MDSGQFEGGVGHEAIVWASKVSPHFQFLAARYGMQVIDTSAGPWEASVTYTRDPVGVIVRRSIEFDRVEIELVRMVDGQVPKMPVFIHEDTAIDRGLFDHAIGLRGSDSDRDALREIGGLESDQVEAALSFLSLALEKLAPDFLGGDLGLLDEIGQIIHARVANHPQQITVNLPEGTPPEAVKRAVAKAKEFDSRVAVAVRFYRRPG